jgi:hypothetical protein
MKNRTRPAPGPGRGHLSPAGNVKRERSARRVRQFCSDAMHDPDMGGWGGPAKGAHPAKPRNLPTQSFVRLDDLDDLAEREAEFERLGVIWRAKGRAFEARCERLRAYRAAVIWRNPQRPQPAFVRRASPRR